MRWGTVRKSASQGKASTIPTKTRVRIRVIVMSLLIGFLVLACTRQNSPLAYAAKAAVKPTETGRALVVGSGPARSGSANLGGCRGGWVRPIRATGDREASKPVRKFDRPAQNWLPGHRGVDLAAEHGAVILAPETGTIVFAGTVAGKSVVSIRHGTAGNLVSTFEPARTSLHPGDQVERGRAWGTVQGHSDHCDGTCLHWGLRTSDRNYLNPMSKVDRHRILLKPG